MRDPYVYPNGVLKNTLNITDAQELKQAEADICMLNLIDVDSIEQPLPGENILQTIHRHIFSDIFEWAGQFRKVPLVKEELVLPGYSVPYSSPNEIKKDLIKRMKDIETTNWNDLELNDLCLTLARKLALLWRVHPFREGNTRTVVAYAYILAKQLGFPFDISTFSEELNRIEVNGHVVKYNVRDKLVLACLDDKDYPEPEHLAQLFKDAILAHKGEKTRSL